ncbi:hypothetical protein EYF80_064726 [Liparis tanakae]|uniref:Uncharacterized protein n=1 Tax=Liparis tanakae TaxID=230148 RepID=A0A4Z2E8A4_9TELE|nr:hypothetical protein EYF80_064726 [Liparis tanakae]
MRGSAHNALPSPTQPLRIASAKQKCPVSVSAGAPQRRTPSLVFLFLLDDSSSARLLLACSPMCALRVTSRRTDWGQKGRSGVRKAGPR